MLEDDTRFYVNKDDKKYIEDFVDEDGIIKNYTEDRRKKDGRRTALHLEVIPEYLVGNISEAQIIILGLNPKYSEKHQKAHAHDETYKNNLKSALKQEEGIDNFAIYGNLENTAEQSYWFKKLKSWKDIDSTNTLEIIKSKVAIVEFFPYATESYDSKYDKIVENTDYLPSQKNTFQLLRTAMKREDKPMIIISKGIRKWLDGLEELKTYDNTYVLLNVQNSSFELNNIQKYSNEKVIEDILKNKLSDK